MTCTCVHACVNISYMTVCVCVCVCVCACVVCASCFVCMYVHSMCMCVHVCVLISKLYTTFCKYCRVCDILEVMANNAGRERASLNSTVDQESSAAIESAPTTPGSAGPLSAASTPASVRSFPGVGTPTSVRSQSSGASPVSRSVRSQSVDSTPRFTAFQPGLESTPVLASDPLHRSQHIAGTIPASTPPAPNSPWPAHLHLWSPTDTRSCGKQSTIKPLQPGSALRQQSSPALLINSRLGARANSTPAPDTTVEEPDTSSAWDYQKCFLDLKGTTAAKEWKFIGRRLGVRESDIEAIEKNNSSNLKEMFYQMLLRWKSVTGGRATKEELIRALREEKLTQIAEMMEADATL